MSTIDKGPAFDRFMAAAEAAARDRPDVDLDLAREVFEEAAILLHNGLALDGLDEHDTDVVVSGLCVDLCAPDPGAAIRSRARSTPEQSRGVHDPVAVSAAYLVAASVLRL